LVPLTTEAMDAAADEPVDPADTLFLETPEIDHVDSRGIE